MKTNPRPRRAEHRDRLEDLDAVQACCTHILVVAELLAHVNPIHLAPDTVPHTATLLGDEARRLRALLEKLVV